jgi:hypothetical protein
VSAQEWHVTIFVVAKNFRQLTVGIFGPRDCASHKKTLRRLITDDQSMQLIARDRGVFMDPFSGDDVVSGPGRAQERINRYIKETEPDLSIFIFKDSFGFDAGLGLTGTEEEWQIAISILKTHAEFDLGLYFASQTPSDQRLIEFRKRIEREYAAQYTLFDSLADFERRVRYKLTVFVRERGSKTSAEPAVAPTSLVDMFASSPLSLGSYPRLLPGGEELPRPELKTLLDRINGQESSTTVVLGERGSGKSALFAALDSELRTSGLAVLSIKADMLGPAVHDEAALDRALGLPLGFAASVQMVAADRKAVVLIDQLDALADVLDRKTERLNVLLNVIRHISGVTNVHLVISSRPFEFHHDARLRSMAADRLDLLLPPWVEVAPVLEKHGYRADSISEPVRELLRNPWTLNEFLRLHPKDVTFDSLFALLEEIWAVTVEAPDAPPGSRELIDDMVQVMSRDEVLWVPRAIAAAREEARRYLEERDVIQLDESQLRVAFRHQSFYEFALVRRFAVESLAAFITAGSQGLFIRPVALAGLAYLRGSSPSRYEVELHALWRASLRAHLRALIVDFIAAQTVPLPTEISIITNMLADTSQGQRALTAIAPYSAWFPILRPTAAFIAWLRRPPAEAVFATGLLGAHAAQSPDDVLDVIEREWLRSSDYDRLSFLAFYNFRSWSERALEVLLHIVERSTLRGTYDLAQQMLGTNPEFAARLLRAELDRRLSEILKAHGDVEHAVERLLEEDEYTGVFADLAETAPAEFLSSLFPWIARLLDATASQEDPRFQTYRHSHVSLAPVGSLPVATMIDVTIGALEDLAAKDADAVLSILRPHLKSDTMSVHALAIYALRVIAPAQPAAVYEYLVSDPRRLAIGNWTRSHQLSKLLIEALVPHLSAAELRTIEAAVLAYDYLSAPDEELPEEQLARKETWNREHRLFLFQSLPDEILSAHSLQAKRDLETEFRGLDESKFGEIKGGMVEAPYSRAELEVLSDDEILARLDEVPDQTGWNHPRRWSEDGERLLGGAVQQSQVIGEIVESNPERGVRLACRFRPREHELAASETISALVKANFDPQRILTLILQLDTSGFESEDFRTAAARALATLSGRIGGLPDDVISLLRRWLEQIEAPTDDQIPKKPIEPPDHPLVFGLGGLFLQPSGRGPVTEAIAAGYLDREPSDIARSVEFVRERLDVEHHPSVWTMALPKLQAVLRENAALGTELFSAIFERHPRVLLEVFVWRLIAHWMRSFTPADEVLRWFDILDSFGDPRSQQALGELLYSFAAHQEAARDRVRAYVADPAAQYVVRGLAYAAAYLWWNVSTRTLGYELFTSQMQRWPKDAARALGTLIIVNHDEVDLDEPTQKMFRRAAEHDEILLDIFPELGEEIEPRTAQEPAFVADIARAFLAVPTQQVEDTLGPIHRGSVPEVITSIALTLHRIPAFASVGLDLFEKLLEANLREAKAATELLDRKPSRLLPAYSRRPRRHPRRRRRTR